MIRTNNLSSRPQRKSSTFRRDRSNGSSRGSSRSESDFSDIEETPSSGHNQIKSENTSKSDVKPKTKRLIESKFSPSFLYNICCELDGSNKENKDNENSDDDDVTILSKKEKNSQNLKSLPILSKVNEIQNDIKNDIQIDKRDDISENDELVEEKSSKLKENNRNINNSEFVTNPDEITKTRCANPLSNFKTSNVSITQSNNIKNEIKSSKNPQLKLSENENDSSKSKIQPKILHKPHFTNLPLENSELPKKPPPRPPLPKPLPTTDDPQLKSILKEGVSALFQDNIKQTNKTTENHHFKNEGVNCRLNKTEKRSNLQILQQQYQNHQKQLQKIQQQRDANRSGGKIKRITSYEPPQNEPRLNSIFDIPSSESNEPFTHDHIVFETSQAEMKDAFVFAINEEGGRLYLFCKYAADPTQFGTICICILSPCYFVQFLPTYEASEHQVEVEIEHIIHSCGGNIVSKRWVTKRNVNFSSSRKYLDVEISSTCNIANIPVKGSTYEAVGGSTLSLSDHFITRNNIKGSKWISVHCSQSPHLQTIIPMYTTLNTSSIEITKGNSKPSMNICIFSTFEKENKIFMLTMRIFYQWDYESLDIYKGLRSARRAIITFIYVPELNNSKKDRTYVYCQSEAELLQNFAEKIDQFDIDIICSYDLINHDLPLIVERMKANNISNWSKLGRYYRSIYPKSLSLLTSGRILLDLKLTFKNLLGIESDTFSSLVKSELEIDRPILDFDKDVYQFGNPKLMDQLISFNRKDTQFIKQILEKKNIIALSEHISRVTGHQWSKILADPPELFIESLLKFNFYKRSFIIPDKKQNIEKYKFKPFGIKAGFYSKPVFLVSCEFLLSKLIKKKNLCFSTIEQVFSDKTKGVLPTLITELLNTYDKLNNETPADDVPIDLGDIKKNLDDLKTKLNKGTKKLYKDSISIVLNTIQKYFEFGSQRFSIEMLGRFIEGELLKYLNSFEHIQIIFCYDGKFLVTCDNINFTLDDLITEFNSHHKNLDLKIEKRFTRVLLLNSGCYLASNDDDQRLFSYNYEFYRYDWCTATKILADNVISKAMNSDSIDIDIIPILQEYPDLSKLEIKDFALTSLLPNKSTPLSQDDPLFEIAKKIEEKGRFLNIEGKLQYIQCIIDGNSIIKSVENVKSIDEIDVNWYKINQFAPGMVLVMKPFSILTPNQIYEAFDIDQNNLEEDRLSFNCFNCNQKNIFYGLNSNECMNCQNCGISFKWKFLANVLTNSITSFVEKWTRCSAKCNAVLCKFETGQIPISQFHKHTDPSNPAQTCKGKYQFLYSSADVYEYLLVLDDLFDYDEEINDNNSDIHSLKDYLKDFIKELKNYHSFENVKFTSLLSTQASETQIINDVCSFLDE
ncbi:hypothetical protein TRFO_42657 [Tritrichomonas foetus]|uniref:DNA-directed DNA polymerase n=1 Tax=Tritrichomonas foetus TaxID=1144522 RepID=A0A1J4L032_9EUKA|nr:hypothetical protein TRFO_42657 [Tritrichomonas foetus]|eukprot:OHT15213.1 hypothetical protein TRFO_42657 [Tritrichomonas foetus]